MTESTTSPGQGLRIWLQISNEQCTIHTCESGFFPINFLYCFSFSRSDTDPRLVITYFGESGSGNPKVPDLESTTLLFSHFLSFDWSVDGWTGFYWMAFKNRSFDWSMNLSGGLTPIGWL